MEAETSGIVQAENPIEVLKKRIMDVLESDNSVVSGFQLATAAGLICDEPMWGLTFVIEACISPLAEQSESNQQSEQYAIFARQVMAAIKDACRAAVLQKKPWLVEAVYFCELTTPSIWVLCMLCLIGNEPESQRRKCRRDPHFSQFMHTSQFLKALILMNILGDRPRVLQVLFLYYLMGKHFLRIPSLYQKQEEIEEFGDGSSVLPNTVRKLIDAARRRKGLPVEEKVVQHATKQRTLAPKV
uniref:Uncharacterized protein n=1 Tax=Populus alba TaxID=43335 RepID=A0A4U5NL46_POPAL|nr:hypothetical protein D5086_0000263270 [Populus alba]